ncbi:A/G-specific adenine glycosylase [Parerythrobacter aestuarii]|uniref:A/G-specific adenine glycosylase n=1 Tax=Parerythrobacter aestuarii TaxID=3020909 RepID=UPI00389AF2CB
MTASDNTISRKLLDWYDRHARDLPWRAMPGEPAPDPYRVWLSEIMLQQTTVAAVKPYFAKFTATWPGVEDLAGADESDVMAAWAGLGYYSRARNLVKAAKVVSGLGGFPVTESELRKLPGVGDYTAAAITAIAFGKRAVVVDANVERVVARLSAIEEPLPKARKAIREQADAITPDERAGDFAQAMMDLGSQVCTAKKPQCLLCPLAQDCAARTLEPERFPVKPLKKAKPVRQGQAFWIERDATVWLVRREGTGMLGGMRALPDDGWSARADGHGRPPLPGHWDEAGSVSHTFTHFALELSVRTYLGSTEPVGEGEWWPLARLDDAGLPTLFAKAARRALAD